MLSPMGSPGMMKEATSSSSSKRRVALVLKNREDVAVGCMARREVGMRFEKMSFLRAKEDDQHAVKPFIRYNSDDDI